MFLVKTYVLMALFVSLSSGKSDKLWQLALYYDPAKTGSAIIYSLRGETIEQIFVQCFGIIYVRSPITVSRIELLFDVESSRLYECSRDVHKRLEIRHDSSKLTNFTSSARVEQNRSLQGIVETHRSRNMEYNWTIFQLFIVTVTNSESDRHTIAFDDIDFFESVQIFCFQLVEELRRADNWSEISVH